MGKKVVEIILPKESFSALLLFANLLKMCTRYLDKKTMEWYYIECIGITAPKNGYVSQSACLGLTELPTQSDYVLSVCVGRI